MKISIFSLWLFLSDHASCWQTVPTAAEQRHWRGLNRTGPTELHQQCTGHKVRWYNLVINNNKNYTLFHNHMSACSAGKSNTEILSKTETFYYFVVLVIIFKMGIVGVIMSHLYSTKHFWSVALQGAKLLWMAEARGGRNQRIRERLERRREAEAVSTGTLTWMQHKSAWIMKTQMLIPYMSIHTVVLYWLYILNINRSVTLSWTMPKRGSPSRATLWVPRCWVVCGYLPKIKCKVLNLFNCKAFFLSEGKTRRWQCICWWSQCFITEPNLTFLWALMLLLKE